jgi:tetratricopeptide (TPR) repeat protein
VLLLLAAAAAARAQELAPKRELLGDSAPACAPTHAAPPSAHPSSTAVDSLLTAGSRAAILGDQAAARALFVRATELDPGNAVAVYRLARTEEELGRGEAAVSGYCRYLALAPSAANAAEVRERIAVLTPAEQSLPAAEAGYLRAGLEAYDRGDFERAVYSFTVVLRGCPDCASVYFDRALANAARRRSADAARDFGRYLELRPDAEDAGPVRAYAARLAGPAAPPVAGGARPGGVLLRGLVVPGLGQYATGRPVWAVAVLGGVAGALYYGTRSHTVMRTFQAEDPFGNPYQYQQATVERTHLGLGVGIGLTLTLGSAIEAYLHAARSGR